LFILIFILLIIETKTQYLATWGF